MNITLIRFLLDLLTTLHKSNNTQNLEAFWVLAKPLRLANNELQNNISHYACQYII